MTTATISAAYPIQEVTHCQINGTNLVPGAAAEDLSGQDVATDAALKATETIPAIQFTADIINAAPLKRRSGRHLHHSQGVWVKFCSHPECDAYVLTYGYYAHVAIMAKHESENH